MLSLILIAFASMCNACMDTLSFHRSVSIWKNSGWFWSVDQHRVKVIGYPVNAWHLLKSLMIVLMVIGAIIYEPVVNPYVDFVLFGVVWNLFFNILFNKILVNKV